MADRSTTSGPEDKVGRYVAHTAEQHTTNQ